MMQILAREFHTPEKSDLIALAQKAGGITIYDYQNNKILNQFKSIH